MKKAQPKPDEQTEVEIRYILDEESKEAAEKLEKKNFKRIIKEELRKLKK